MLLSLTEALSNYKLHVLTRMARTAEIEVPDRRKETLVNALVQRLYTPTAINRAMAHMNSREIACLQRLQAVDGEVRSTGLKLAMVRARLVEESPNHAAYSRYNPPPADSFETVITTLLERGLVLTRGSLGGGTLLDLEPGAVLWIPIEARRHLPPLPESKAHTVEIHSTREGSARTFQRDLYLYWSHLREKPLTPTQALWLRKSDLRAVNEKLLVKSNLGTGSGEKDARRLFFLRRLLQELDMLSHKRNQVVANEKAPFLALEPAERVKRCFELWSKGRFWNEIFGVTDVNLRTNDTAIALAHSGIVTARETVLRQLARLPHEGWVLTDTLVNRLRDQEYEFLIPRNRNRNRLASLQNYSFGVPSNPYTNNPYGWLFDRIYGEESGWYRIEAEFARSVVREGLYWLGLVDLGYEPETLSNDKLGEPPPAFTAYRLTDMGRWLLGSGPMPQVNTDSGRVIVQPNFDVFALDPVTDMVLADLDQFCDRLSAERAVHYQITRQSVYRGSRRGWDVPRIIEFLNSVSKSQLPQNVERDLREWAIAMQRVVVHTHVSLLQTTSPALLDGVLHDHRVAGALQSRPSPDVALLVCSPTHVDQVFNALLAAGHLPARTRTDLATPVPSLTVTPAGTVNFQRRLPSIYLIAQVEPFCEQTDSETWQITAPAVHNAIDNGWTAASILDTLRTLNIGPLPPRFDLKIKAWAGHFGEARLQTLTLLQFGANKILDELMTDADVGPLLTRFVTADPSRALAVVDADNVERLCELLTERGVVFKGKIV